MQLTLINCEQRELILGCPVVRTYWKELSGKHYQIDVMGGRFQGDEYVYIIKLKEKISTVQYYCGSTKDLLQRFKQHRRKWPLYRLDKTDIESLLERDFPDELTRLQRKTFRRKHTFLQAVAHDVGTAHAEYSKIALLSAAKKHTSNGLIMAANQRGIP